MPAPAAIAGTFAEIRTVKSRSVVVMCIEVPIEQAAAIIEAFGFPQPGAEVPVAVARLKPAALSGNNSKDLGARSGQSPAAAERERKPWAEMPSAQQAGIRCMEPAFQQFMHEVKGAALPSAEDAALRVRWFCGVTSRSDIDRRQDSAGAWGRLDREYRAWLDAPKYGAA